MSKRSQETQGGDERYGGGFNNNSRDMDDKPLQANAAQMARRKIAQVKKSTASARSSRANTPTANPFAPQQQSFPSFQPPQQEGSGGGFNFSVNAQSNPFQNGNGASGTPPPPGFGMGQQAPQQNGSGGLFGNNSFGTTFGSTASTQPQQNGFTFGQGNSTNGNNTPTFGGFGQSNQTQTQQNGTTPASATQSFSFGQTNGSTNTGGFQFGQTQQQTQSTASTSFGGSFGQKPQTNGDKPAAPSFGGFGQNAQQPASDKPATPSFGNFGQNTQQNADKPATPSFSFGQNTSTQPQTNGNKAPMFGATPQAEQTPKASTGGLFTFNSQNQGIGTRATPEASSKPAETPKAPMSNLFGSQPNTGKSLFGSTPPPRESSATPKPSESLFSMQNKPKLGGNLFTPDMAEGTKPETPAPIFGQQAQQNGPAAVADDQTPKASNPFAGFGQPQANVVQETPKPSSNLFSTSTFGQTPSQQNPAPKSLFNHSVQDTSMLTPGSTPQKQSLFTPAASQAAPSAPGETPAAGRSLFDRISKPADTPTTAQKEPAKPSFTPSTGLFNNQTSQSTPSSNLFSKQNEQAAPRAPTSERQTSTTGLAATSTAPKALTSERQTSTTGLAVAPRTLLSERQTSTTGLGRSSSTVNDTIPDNEKETFKVLNEGLAAHLSKQDPTVDWTTIMEYYLQQAANIRHKPAPDLAALNAAPSTTAAPTRNTEQSAAPPALAASEEPPLKKPNPFNRAQASASRPSSGSGSGSIFASSSNATPKAPTPFQPTDSSASQQTPRPSFLQPPSTAPVNRKRSAEDEPERPPATEKRSRPNDPTVYPKLPENASDTAKNFLAGLERPRPASTSQSSQSQSQSQSTQKDRQPSKSGFTPSSAGFTPSASGFKPSSSGFKPSVPSTGSNNFLSAFGSKASEQEEKDRKKRKDEDYDSDEETEEQWAARDRREQEAKRQKSIEAAKAAPGFVFKPSSKPAEKEAGKEASKQTSEATRESEANDKDDQQDQPTAAGQGKSLFDRISKPATSTGDSSPSLFSKPASSTAEASQSLFSSQTPTSKPPSSNIFGGSATGFRFGGTPNIFGNLNKPASADAPASQSAEKGESIEKQTQGLGDNTWNKGTPIKFGAPTTTDIGSTTPAAPPPKFGNLFGLKAQDSSSSGSGLLNVPASKPGIGFTFGAQPSTAGGSRATTPGVTTDGEGASTAGEGENEPSDDPLASEAQVEDMTGLSAEESKGETLLFSVPIGKACKWDEKKDDEGGMAQGWVDKGKGPLYLLKNNDTGTVRILLKVPPYGAAKMNFPAMKGQKYEVQGKTGKQVVGTFYDHMADKPGLGKWLVQVGKKEDMDEVSRILKEAAAVAEN